MAGTYFSYALLAALATGLVIAAITDLRRREIDNWLNLAIAAAAPIYWLAAGLGWVDVAFLLAQALVTLVACTMLFVIRQMGGGDVKLLTAVALWFPPLTFFQLVFMMGILGGGASIAMALCNMERRPGEAARDALAAVAGGVWVFAAAAIAFALVAGRPAFGGGALKAMSDALSRPWIAVAIAVIGLGVLALGLIHILRRQKAPLPVPYGIAISAAGLWVLGDRAMTSARLGGGMG